MEGTAKYRKDEEVSRGDAENAEKKIGLFNRKRSRGTQKQNWVANDN
jgi:hypothetical protein